MQRSDARNEFARLALPPSDPALPVLQKHFLHGARIPVFLQVFPRIPDIMGLDHDNVTLAFEAAICLMHCLRGMRGIL